MRILQGIGGALMVPVGRLAVLRTTPKHQLIKAIATLTWPALVAPIIGPPLGGFITRYASWHWIFFINVPLGLIAIACRCASFPISAKTERRPLTSPALCDIGCDGEPGERDGAARRSPAAGWPTLALLGLGTAVCCSHFAISAGRTGRWCVSMRCRCRPFG
jgi:MFS family permease